MKRFISLLLSALMLISMSTLLLSCSSSLKEPEPEPETEIMYTVTFYEKSDIIGIRKLGEMKVKEGSVIGDVKYDDPPIGIIQNYTESWYTDKSGKDRWNLYKDQVRCDLKLYLMKDE